MMSIERPSLQLSESKGDCTADASDMSLANVVSPDMKLVSPTTPELYDVPAVCGDHGAFSKLPSTPPMPNLHIAGKQQPKLAETSTDKITSSSADVKDNAVSNEIRQLNQSASPTMMSSTNVQILPITPESNNNSIFGGQGTCSSNKTNCANKNVYGATISPNDTVVETRNRDKEQDHDSDVEVLDEEQQRHKSSPPVSEIRIPSPTSYGPTCSKQEFDDDENHHVFLDTMSSMKETAASEDDDKDCSCCGFMERTTIKPSTNEKEEEYVIPHNTELKEHSSGEDLDYYKNLYFCGQRDLYVLNQKVDCISEENRLLKRKLIELQRQLFHNNSNTHKNQYHTHHLGNAYNRRLVVYQYHPHLEQQRRVTSTHGITTTKTAPWSIPPPSGSSTSVASATATGTTSSTSYVQFSCQPADTMYYDNGMYTYHSNKRYRC